MKMQIKNVIKNILKKRLKTYMSIFFNPIIHLVFYEPQNYIKMFNNPRFDNVNYINTLKMDLLYN